MKMQIKTDLSPSGKKIVEEQLREYSIVQENKKQQQEKELLNKKQLVQLNYPTMIPPKDHIFRRLYMWLGKTLLKPKRFERWGTWWFIFPLQIELFIRTILSEKVTREAYDKRMDVCVTCPQNTILLSRTEEGFRWEHYCKSCGCWMWPPAKLNKKNWFSGWSCPLRKHEGPYLNDDVVDYIKNYNKEHGGDSIKTKPKSCCGKGE